MELDQDFSQDIGRIFLYKVESLGKWTKIVTIEIRS